MQLFVPEVNAGRRYQNTFLTVTWLLEIASYVNTSFNIFIYYSMGSRYRETVRALFFCGRGGVPATRNKAGTEQTVSVSVVSSTARR